MAAQESYLFNFTANSSQDFVFPASVTDIVATGTWGTAQLDIGLWDENLGGYQTIDSWTSATLPQRSEFGVAAGSKGRLTVSGVSTTNLNVTIKKGMPA